MKWLKGKHGYDSKWSQDEQKIINTMLRNCNKSMPSEIHRAVRTLDEISYWKGTEYRTFLLYIGIVVLKNNLTNELYNHYLLLCCAVTICSCDFYKAYLPKAREMFEEYIEDQIDLYGIHSIISNVHNLSHIVDDVEQFGNLNEISAYEFENCLGKIKSKLKLYNKPLEQIARRLIELSNSNLNSFENNVQFKPIMKNRFSNSESNKFNDIVIRPNVLLSNRKFGDKWFLTRENQIVEMKYVFRMNDEFIIRGEPIKEKSDFFTYLFSSRHVNIFGSDGQKDCCMDFNIKSIKAKMICLMCDLQSNSCVFIPLLHSLV